MEISSSFTDWRIFQLMIFDLMNLLSGLPTLALLAILVVSLLVLAKGADMLVDEAVALSLRFKVPPVVIGATIVSLGTTLPEAAVSVMGALHGNPELALGNAVGSIIADTGLILGLAAIIKPLPLERSVVNRQGWIQLGAGFLLVLACFPWSNPSQVFNPEAGGVLPQWMGWVFCLLLVAYLYATLRWSKLSKEDAANAAPLLEVPDPAEQNGRPVWLVFLKFALGVGLVVGTSQILIPTVELTAERVGVPDAIIAATLVALGTSLPELVTAITAVRKNQGALAVGNVIGADILNVLFVAGVSAAVTPGGLAAGIHFFVFLFPSMLFLLIVFRIGIYVCGSHLSRGFGFVLLGGFVAVMILSYTVGISLH